ncbi:MULTISPECIES: DEAD/DEAH box helicase [Niastella]|uniref:SNF2 helicase associated domain-containing protein n=1 Tax=Niastella soli TaxID=2821487 RepID=A0ABS3Z4C7_9BACT|nr:DEAD/DEAH box helicase [Niastella soli]MBO9205012.1 SNF2 helicase associated domain-containing protein [Niastella soli]
MVTSEFMSDFQQLLPKDEPSIPVSVTDPGNAKLFIVLKQYKFHKQLCIELYQAETTQAGKIKNPLTLINPLDLTLKTNNVTEIKFFSAIARFQNNPTAARTASDLDALKSIIKNPLQLDFFYHNPEFSENIVAGSIQPVTMGAPVQDLSLWVQWAEPFYEMTLQATIDGKEYNWNELRIKYDYFFHTGDAFYVIGNFHLVNVVRFFARTNGLIRIHESKFKSFQENIIIPLADHLTIVYPDSLSPMAEQVIQPGIGEGLEKVIYLSELGNYVIIDPVMKYGNIEIPVRTKRQLYITDEEGKIQTMYRNEPAETGFIALLIKQHPDFFEQLDNDLRHFYLHKSRFLAEEWFFTAFEVWEKEGITIYGFNKLKGNRLNSHRAKVSIKVTSGLNWFSTDIKVGFGNQQASLSRLQHAVRNKNKYVQLGDGTLGILPEQWIEKLADYFTSGEIIDNNLITPKINFSEVKKLYEEQMLDTSVKRELSLYTEKIATNTTIQEVEVPDEFHGSLRHYQHQGLNWLNFIDDYNFGGILADDMGLGKSIQIIAFILLQRNKTTQNTNLLVVPTSLLFNWQEEVQKFAPSIKILTLYNADRQKNTSSFDNYEIILTSYGTLISDITFLQHYTFNYVFLDESQNIKNIESQRYQAARLLRSRNKIAITGTPVENNTFDLYAQLSFACPGLLGSKQHFKHIYSTPIDTFKVKRRSIELQKKIAPFILRRTKAEVATELPDKTEMICYCPMGEEQRKVYDDCEKELRDFLTDITNEEISKNSMHVLRGLTRLRQICNSPQLLKDEKLQGDGSAKIEMLLEQIESKSPQHKILIFSQFVGMLHLIQKELEARNIPFELLTGKTKNRETAVHNFQNEAGIRVFLISLKAGGTGLNLTAADYVYIVDPWWNPAVENQAIDRSYRIGQKKNVVAVRLITPGTIEEKIVKLQNTKKELSDKLIKTATSYLNGISKAEILSLLNI